MEKPKQVDLDRFSNLPEPLIFEILLNLPTNDVVKTSALSSRWRNLWRYVPSLDLGYDEFPDSCSFISFVDSFMAFDGDSCLEIFILKNQYVVRRGNWFKVIDLDRFSQWMEIAIRRKVQYLYFMDSSRKTKIVEMPLTVYTSQSLVSLKLREVVFLKPKSVSLPCLKVMYLKWVKFANDQCFQMLVSGCPSLESLTVTRCYDVNVQTLYVCSQSLLSFIHVNPNGRYLNDNKVVVIDAPRLEKLELNDHSTDRYVIGNIGSLDKAVLNVKFGSPQDNPNVNDVEKGNMIRCFLHGISSVKDMVITLFTLQTIYGYVGLKDLPLFRNLSSLRATISYNNWEMLASVLESSPNLKTLSLGVNCPWNGAISIIPLPHCFLQTIEVIEIEIFGPKRDDDAGEMELVSYFLGNSTILKKFTFCLGVLRKNEEPVILEKLLAIPKLSSSCQVFVRCLSCTS